MAALTEEQIILRDAARTWIREQSPVSALRRLRDNGSAYGYDPAVYSAMAEMGWTGVIIPEAYGGLGLGCRCLGLILEETGRTLTASPLLSSAAAASSAIVSGGDERQKAAWLPQIATGNLLASLAVDELPHHRPEHVALMATRSGTGYALSGAKCHVLEGGAAELFVVSARTAGDAEDRAGITLFLVPADTQGLGRRELKTIDSRGAANLVFDTVEVGPESVLGEVNKGWDLLDKTLDCARAGLAAEMLGAALEAFEITLGHLKTRIQFGRLIGSFQALQHRAASMFIQLELARSCVEAALTGIDDHEPDSAELVSLAKSKMGEVLHLVSNEMIQMHGGMGVADAHDAGFYLKRARVAEATFGNRSFHRDRYARLNGY